jgi:hypothetical protein
MRRTTARRITRTSALIAATGLLAGCATHPPPPISASDLQLAREFGLFTTYWVGPEFAGIPLTAADSKRDYDATVGMRVYYGTCRTPSSILSTSGCQLPLEIATVVYKPHTNEGLGARREALIRGVPAVIFDHGSSIELYTGRVAIDVYAQDARLAEAAAAALVPLNRPDRGRQDLAPPRFLEPGVDPAIKALADSMPAPAPARVVHRRRGG